MRERYLPGRGMVSIGEWYKAQPVPKRSDLPCPNFITDQLDIQSMADGRHYDSKQAYYASLKSKGYEIVGNDAPTTGHDPLSTPGGVEQDIKTAIEQLRGQP